MRGWLIGGGLIRGVTQVLGKRWGYLRGRLFVGGGGLIDREIWYMFPSKRHQNFHISLQYTMWWGKESIKLD